MASRAAALVLVMALFAGASAQMYGSTTRPPMGTMGSMGPMGGASSSAGSRDIATLQVQFDNRGSKVEGKGQKLIPALAKIFGVPPNQVAMTGVIGQSSLLNHQSVATFMARGPTNNGLSTYDNCVAAVKKGWFSKSQVEKNLKKASDTWMPFDSVKVQKATCGAPGKKQVSGRRL